MAKENQASSSEQNDASLPQKLLNVLGSAFKGYNEETNESNAILEDAPLVGLGSDWHVADQSPEQGEPERDSLSVFKRPKDRAGKYKKIQEIMNCPTANEGLDIHISHAFSPDTKTNLSFTLEATAPEHEKLVTELNARLVPKMSKSLPSQAKICAGFGVNFIRPYAVVGQGITHLQSDYYTMPQFVRKYERAGLVAGYTSMHLKDHKKSVELAPPWSLLEMKIPFFEPDVTVEPNRFEGRLYSLYDDVYSQNIVETQDYGTSFLEHSFEPYHHFKEAIESLRASRRNASRIDRLIATQLEDLDPIAAAEVLNLIGSQLKANREYTEQRHASQGTKPLINDSVIPVQGGGKGGVSIDTQTTSADIQHIEDVMLYARLYTSSFGLDLSLLGWSSDLSGGLGEGGFLQNSIQSARRSLWLRQAAEEYIMETLDLDFYYRHQKILPDGIQRPWRVKFYSQNSAVEEKESAQRESKINQATMIVTLVDMIKQGESSKSPTLVKSLLDGSLSVDKATLETILSELSEKSQHDDSEDELMSALSGLSNYEQMQLLLGRLAEHAE